jgi:hypothetical protein
MKVQVRAASAALLFLCSSVLAVSEAPQDKAQRAIPRIKKIAADPAVIEAVKGQNAKKTPLAAIKNADAAWISGETKLSDQIAARPCSVRLQHLLNADKELTEAFAMDDQGANVCMSDRTSDYWQGDEVKWQKSFNGGKGAVFVDERHYDSSAQAVIVQVSVPVLDQGKVIGALTVGVKAEEATAAK